jgi:hypothetical protein
MLSLIISFKLCFPIEGEMKETEKNNRLNFLLQSYECSITLLLEEVDNIQLQFTSKANSNSFLILFLSISSRRLYSTLLKEQRVFNISIDGCLFSTAIPMSSYRPALACLLEKERTNHTVLF